jgi:hypothetical protein
MRTESDLRSLTRPGVMPGLVLNYRRDLPGIMANRHETTNGSGPKETRLIGAVSSEQPRKSETNGQIEDGYARNKPERYFNHDLKISVIRNYL